MTTMTPVKLNGRWNLLIPEHRAARPDWHRLDGWEGPRLLAMSKAIGRGSTVFYVGAEEGEMPALCQSWGAKVAMFEPNPRVWPNIRAIWQANDLPDPAGCFVGFAGHETRGDSEVSVPWPECAYGPVIGDHGFCNLDERPDIPSVRIDDYVATTGIVPTDISIDVEGAEWQVLRGAEKTIIERHPKIWLSGHPEFIWQHWGEYLGDCRYWLKDRGYRETYLDYQHECHFLYEGVS